MGKSKVVQYYSNRQNEWNVVYIETGKVCLYKKHGNNYQPDIEIGFYEWLVNPKFQTPEVFGSAPNDFDLYYIKVENGKFEEYRKRTVKETLAYLSSLSSQRRNRNDNKRN